jgi:putative endonuclease
MPCNVYVLRSETTGRYYVGSAEHIDNRVIEHNAGRVSSTRSYRPWVLVYHETFASRADATRREREIKRMKSRRWIEVHLLGLNGPEGSD